jgi:D-inositol-3-phosphate glycosyltransferase
MRRAPRNRASRMEESGQTLNRLPRIMQTISVDEESFAQEAGLRPQAKHDSLPGIEIGLLTGCKDKPYVFGLATALGSKDIGVDIVGSDEIDSPELHTFASLRFLNFFGRHNPDASFVEKLSKVLRYYGKLARYVARSSPKILHILWNNKFELFDRTILMLYYKALGKRIAFTAHNVNQAQRDGNDSWLNRVTLRLQYRLCDHIFVHTQKMKAELCQEFAVTEKTVTVIPFPINNALPDTELTSVEAKRRLGLREDERAILFFGRVRPYKGTEYLLDAFRLLSTKKQVNYRLIIAGEPIKGCEEYLKGIQRIVTRDFDQGQVMLRMQFIPDDEVEVYLKAADVLVLPYKEIFQSGVLFLAYAFGLPVVATDVGSFREEIVEGNTGFLCKAGDPPEMTRAIEAYFASNLYKNLNARRREIKEYANTNHSWHAVADLTCGAYAKMLGRDAS